MIGRKGQGRACFGLAGEGSIRIPKPTWGAWDREKTGTAAFDPLGLIGNVERLLSQPAFGACPVDTLRTNPEYDGHGLRLPPSNRRRRGMCIFIVPQSSCGARLGAKNSVATMAIFADRSGRVECVRWSVTPKSYPGPNLHALSPSPIPTLL